MLFGRSRVDENANKLDIDKSEAKQKDRMKFIAELQVHGILNRVESRDVAAEVWVEPGFYRLDFKDKEQFLNVVYCYYFSRDNCWLNLRDNKSGKKIGKYHFGSLTLD